MITQAHRDEYEEVGCVRIEGAFDQHWIDKLTTAIERVTGVFRAGDTPEAVWDCSVPISPTYYQVPGGEQLNGIMACAEEFQDWMMNSPATQLVGELTGADDLRFWVDAVFHKAGCDTRQATPWHNDECTYGYKGTQIPSLWLALTDVSEDNAPLLTLAGSNHDPHRYHSTFAPQDAKRPDDYLPWQHLLDRVAAPEADIRSWPVRAGDALLIHPKTIHGSRARTGSDEGSRLSFSTRWLGSDAVWDPNPLTLPLANLPDQNILVRGEAPPESIFPVVWRRAG